jgi:hypothetical protein
VKGEGAKNTEAFTVGHNWMVSWETKPGEFSGNFQVFLYSAADNSIAGTVANVMGKNTDHSMEYSPGTYYLQINADQPYALSVSDYH